jgi:hypothetical protein
VRSWVRATKKYQKPSKAINIQAEVSKDELCDYREGMAKRSEKLSKRKHYYRYCSHYTQTGKMERKQSCKGLRYNTEVLKLYLGEKETQKFCGVFFFLSF